MSKDIHTLSRRISELETASMFTARDIAQAAARDALKIMQDHDQRLERVERLTKNMELLKP